MYQVTKVLENAGDRSLIAEISFHPCEPIFAVTYETTNEIRVYDSRTLELSKILKNPVAQIYGPHGILFTDKYLLVSNKMELKKPSTINVYRNDRLTDSPIQVFQTPFDHLREAHSLALRDGILVATYTQNISTMGAIVCYRFDDEKGEISGPLDKTESWFTNFGDCKGICFDEDKARVLVTFESEKPLSMYRKMLLSFESDKNLAFTDKVKNFSRRTRDTLHSLWNNDKVNTQSNKNGVAIFPIDADGKIARSPENVMLSENFCRLENIDIFAGTCVITDTVNHRALLYNLNLDPMLEHPIQTIDFCNALPHGATFSPDGEQLIVSTLGAKVSNQVILWGQWASPREDKIFVYERAIATRTDARAA